MSGPSVKPLAPGVPDMHSYRAALEMGYEVHEDGLWWPVYGKPGYYTSPNGKKTKFVPANVNKKNWAWH